jgi:hypothetical protein
MSTIQSYDGKPIIPASEQAIEGFVAGSSQPVGVARNSPFSWNAKDPTASMKVGWILKHSGKEIANFAFSINPQSITRTPTTRTQMFATRGKFYVDDFGAGPETIQINQLVASGRYVATPAQGFQTLREHVLQFHDEIYLQAAGPGYSNSPLEVFFYDNHLYYGTTEAAYVPERVYFPQQGFQLLRSISLNNVWQAQITMVSLEKPSNPINFSSGKKKTKIIIVEENETLHKISVQQSGRNATAKRILQVEKAIISLNKGITKNRTIPVYSPTNTATIVSEVEVKRLHVVKGEKLIVPA